MNDTPITNSEVLQNKGLSLDALKSTRNAKVTTGTWNPDKVQITVIWGDLKHQTSYDLQIHDWKTQLESQYNNPHTFPVVLNALTINTWQLKDGKIIEPHNDIKFSVWHGIYRAWENCPTRIPSRLDPSKPVIVRVWKINRKDWIISEIRQN